MRENAGKCKGKCAFTVYRNLELKSTPRLGVKTWLKNGLIFGHKWNCQSSIMMWAIRYTLDTENRPRNRPSFESFWTSSELRSPDRGPAWFVPALSQRLEPHLGQYFQYSPAMSYVGPSTSSPQPTERIGQTTTSGNAQPQRYAPFSSYAYWLVSQLAPWVIVLILHRSTSSMTIPFSTSSISIGQFF